MRDGTFTRSSGRKQLDGGMAKVIEFYLRRPLAKKVKPIPIEQRGRLIEFPKETFAAESKTKDITGRGEGSPSTVPFFCGF